ncbi:DUF4175 family protein [Acidiphilium sp.]|uniref:DUF4175 family protein n=1 Tax=Acidiphilium sp. TaxID=527 RepID=UPI003D042121
MIAQRLERLRRRARVVLMIEAVAIAALWPLGVVALFLIVTLLGAGGWPADVAALLALIAALARARHQFSPPEPAAIDRRIERDSRLRHRPIAGFEDVPALITPLGNPLWQAHRNRIDAVLSTARVGRPAPDFAAHDPLALRALLVLALIASWIAAGGSAGSRLAASLSLPRLFGAGGARVQGWITPPRWTGEAPRLITPGAKVVHALTGSSLSLIVTGAGDQAPRAMIAGHALRFAAIARGSYRTTLALTAPATITIGPFWHRIARYHLVIGAPTPPQIGFTTPPYPDPDGKRTNFSWRATSPYGLTHLVLQFRPLLALGAKPDAASVPLGAAPHGDALLDLLASPYAGMPVAANLRATNKAGQTGTSGMASVTLPAPILHNRTAQAIEAIRRRLALTPQDRPALAAALGAIARTPPGPITPATQRDLAAFAREFAAGSPKARDPEAKLWTLVQRAEQGAAFRAAQQLAAARHALEAALNKALAGTSPSAVQLQKLLAELDAASQAHLSAQGQKAPTSAQLSQMSAISQLAQQIADEAAAGDTAQAQRDLAKLHAMLRQLQNAKAMSAAQRAKQQAVQQAEGSLSKLMRQESRLMDRTAQQDTPAPMGNQAGQPPSPESQELAQQQRSLEQQLQQATQAMAQAGLPPSSRIGEGQRAMHSAATRLQMGDEPGAVPAERAAIAALQQAEGALQAMQTGHGSGGGPSGLGQRASGGHGEYGNQSRGVISLGRAGARSDARTIQNELIRRDAEPNLAPPAHDYYRRLLGKDF